MRIDKSDKKCKMISEFKMINFEFKSNEETRTHLQSQNCGNNPTKCFSVSVLFDRSPACCRKDCKTL